MSEKEKKKREISRMRAVKNNLYACKLLSQICPSQVIHGAVMQFLSYFEWLFYSAFFMRFVINSLEAGDGFFHIMTFVIIVAVVMCCMSFYERYLVGYIYNRDNPSGTRGIPPSGTPRRTVRYAPQGTAPLSVVLSYATP